MLTSDFESKELPENRADLVLFFGIFSLFLCGPLGVAAWLIGASDLRRIREGRMSSRKLGALKVGTALGIVGTVFFVVAVTLAAMLIHSGPGGLIPGWQAQPLAPEHMVFAGEWHGKDGSVILISQEGTAEFKTAHMSVSGGRVTIQDDYLSIGLLGISKKWHIDKWPHRIDGNWAMELDGEEFVRKGDELLV